MGMSINKLSHVIVCIIILFSIFYKKRHLIFQKTFLLIPKSGFSKFVYLPRHALRVRTREFSLLRACGKNHVNSGNRVLGHAAVCEISTVNA